MPDISKAPELGIPVYDADPIGPASQMMILKSDSANSGIHSYSISKNGSTMSKVIISKNEMINIFNIVMMYLQKQSQPYGGK